MKLFTCGNCQNLLYFENSVCLNCGHTVGFDKDSLSMITLVAGNGNGYTQVGNSNNVYKFCENAQNSTCNWLLPQTHNGNFCTACNLNRTIPALTANNIELWRNIEIAKHRLVYSLIRLGLPIERKVNDSAKGIVFDFLSDEHSTEHVMTGHDNGAITLNVDEADEVKRVLHKAELGERYRTLLGHFRHEIGHYYWDVLLQNNPQDLQTYRNIFGNENIDYSSALQAYYKNGAPANWMDNYISPYATSHPWEDWAETWAHYLHMMDTLETATSFNIRVEAKQGIDINIDPYSINDFNRIIEMWLPLTFAMNSLNRSMGKSDFYPFIISGRVIEKLHFIHGLCTRNRFLPA